MIHTGTAKLTTNWRETMSTGQHEPEGPMKQSVEKLRGELDRWLDSARSQGDRAMDALGIRLGSERIPAIDIIERPDAIVVEANLPGVAPSMVDVTVGGNVLTISCEIARPDVRPQDQLRLEERSKGPFKRSIPLPEGINPDDVTAQSRHGVLTVRVGKLRPDEPKRVVVTEVEQHEPEHTH